MNSDNYQSATEIIRAIEKISDLGNEEVLKIVKSALEEEVKYITHISGPESNHTLYYSGLIRFIDSEIKRRINLDKDKWKI